MTKQKSIAKAEHPLRIFISYGHAEHPLCRRIADALRERGHEVWFDQDQLHEGANWRREIAEGLRSSNGVVACLSDHYVRSRSVCLDELNIVIGVKGGEHIYTILLGDEKIIPATLSHNQWLDMRDWEERLARNPETFREWFDECMEKLFRILETTDNQVFSGEIQTLQELLHVFPNTSRQSALLKKPFVGRKWLTRRLEDWLDDENGARVLFLCGSPGVGKSAFAAHYTHYNPRVAAAIFCRAKEHQFNDPGSILKMLAYLLACRVPDYRRSLLMRLGILESPGTTSDIKTGCPARRHESEIPYSSQKYKKNRQNTCPFLPCPTAITSGSSSASCLKSPWHLSLTADASGSAWSSMGWMKPVLLNKIR